MSNPFEYVNAINFHKNIPDEEFDEKAYVPFIINKQFSYFEDTVLIANEMNLRSSIPNISQFKFFINIIRPRKRFSKWAKPDKDEKLNLIVEYFGYNYEKAKSVYNILTDDDYEKIKTKLDKGGVK